MSQPLPLPAEPRTERLLIGGFAVLAVVSFLATGAILIARATGHLPLAPDTFSVLTSWTIALTCLGLGVSVIRDEDPRLVQLVAALDIGNPALDGILGQQVRRRWRGRNSTRLLFTMIGGGCWLASVVYSVQMALAVYSVGVLMQLFTLIFFLALAIWSTVIVATAPAECRRTTALELVTSAHRAQRERREAMQRAALDADTGQFERPRFDVIDGDCATDPPVRRTRYGASG